MALAFAEADCQKLIDKCVGKEVMVPYLISMLPTWNAAENKYEKEVDEFVESWGQKWYTDPSDLKRHRGGRLGLFARLSVPHADWEGVKFVALWVAWIYFYDDVIDLSDLDDDQSESLSKLRDQALACVQRAMVEKDSNEETIAGNEPPVQSLYDFTAHVRQHVKSAATSYAVFQSRIILDIPTYLGLRMNSSGDYPTLASILCTTAMDPPSWFFENRLVKEATRLFSMIISISNDILSIHCDLPLRHVDNIVPLLIYHQRLDAQGAVGEAARMLRNCHDEFVALEPQLIELGRAHGISRDIDIFICSCKDAAIGLLEWQYRTKRYFDYDPSWGAVEIPLMLTSKSTVGEAST